MISKLKKSFQPVILSTLICLTVSAPAYSAKIEGVNFNNTVIINGKKASLRGTSLLRYMIFIKAYVGAFYLNEDILSDKALGNVERRLVLHYFHSISAQDFADSTTEMIEKNVSPNRFKALQPQIQQLNALYRDVKPGDEYTATYIPGIGTELALNGRPLGVVPGAEYSAAFFSIWLGKNPIDTSFRKGLLGK